MNILCSPPTHSVPAVRKRELANLTPEESRHQATEVNQARVGDQKRRPDVACFRQLHQEGGWYLGDGVEEGP